MKFFLKDTLRIASIATYVTLCFTFLGFAQSQIPKSNKSVIVEQTTPPAAEGPLTIDDIKPLMLSDKTPAKEQGPASLMGLPQQQSTAPTPQ